ncbi:MAG: hypothetical protein UU47_C0005G0006 [candidate division TM6 bacterium GW2011_GWE2_41_16]|nr:MAG: hypothetical protein UU47_C0005G0006 [candidate division TM6 bacterium GW2011_GWE2_41_16]
MLLIIDGYNVIGTQYDVKNSPQHKKNFINMVKAYATTHKHATIHLVFDGGPSAQSLSEQHKNLTITHAGYQSSADKYIINLVRKNKNDEIVVVSFDRALCAETSNFGATQLDPDAWFVLLRNKTEQKKPQQTNIIKISDQENTELDELMRLAANMPCKEKDEDFQQQRTKTGAMPSRQDKKLKHIIKKI